MTPQEYDSSMLLRFLFLTLISLFVPGVLSAQSVWVLQSSGTAAGLRGIHAVSSRVAWASGTDGTVLRTVDGGRQWTACAVPPDGAKLDFRGVWAWNATDAVAMSSGPGELSRIYKTTDECRSWTLLAMNHDKAGFWDAMVFQTPQKGYLLGDPVDGRFVFLSTINGGDTWTRSDAPGLAAKPDASGAFAASNTSLLAGLQEPVLFGGGGAWVYRRSFEGIVKLGQRRSRRIPTREVWSATQIPLNGNGQAAGVFSLAYHADANGETIVAVGGNYMKPDESAGTAARTTDGGLHWTAAAHPPHGYRSAVAWDGVAHAWIAVGINGSDISYDNGKDWQPLGEGDWNALSLPFVVGPKGRIGRLNAAALAGK